MDRLDRFDRVVSAVYDAALQPDLWPVALDATMEMLSCDIFHSFVWDLEQERPTMTWASVSASENIHRLYNEYYGRIDPRRALAEALGPGQPFACHQHYDERFVGGSEFYQDFLIPCGLRYMVGSTLARDDRHRASVALLRATGRPEFSAGDIETAWRIAPHLRRAMEMMLRTGHIADALAAGDRALDCLDMGVAVLDDARGVRYLNPAAEGMLRPGACMGVVAGRLVAVQRDCAARLARTWHQVKATGQPESVLMHGSAGPSAANAVLLTFSRLPTASPLAEAQGPRYLALMAYRARQGLPSIDQLMHLFGLTRAEGQLAHELAAGRSLAEVARARGVRISTVRTQLLGLLAKTGTQRQQDLVALLGRMPKQGSNAGEGERVDRGSTPAPS
jgi:DNA-binding CsgD family transcriptional regulator/PAS domain-containing protein